MHLPGGSLKTKLAFLPALLLPVSILCCIPPAKPPVKGPDEQLKRLSAKAQAAASFCAGKKFNTDFCILLDLGQHSGKNRVFLWDLKKDSVILSALCSHGCGRHPWGGTSSAASPEFSNVPDSHCSSLGKYKVGKRGYSQWGIHVNYQLHGLETSNSNALKREIVLHSWSDVPEREVYPLGTPEGWGCPAVSDSFMKAVDKKIQDSEGPVLLWVFN